MKDITRIDIINFILSLIKGHSYLEIGSGDHSCFKEINCPIKEDIEPNPTSGVVPTYKMPSDEAFFRILKKYDMIFIDGLHHCDQVAQDVYNACQHLNPGGFIVLHDCIPEKEPEQNRTPTGGSWTGDVWKFQAWLVKHFENVWTIPENWGCGIIQGALDFNIPTLDEMLEFDWKIYTKNWPWLLRVVDWEV
jgi:hypothetical protein